MGCISSKENTIGSPKERLSRKGSVDRRVAHVNSSRREEAIRSKDKSDSVDVDLKLVGKKSHGSNRFNGDQANRRQKEHPIVKKKVENYEVDTINLSQIDPVFGHPGLDRVPKGLEGEQVAAGWPSWLVSVAGVAIGGWVPRRANTFEKLDRIGQGTYSNVYKARDVTNDKIVALKKVRFDKNDPESVKFMAREILILRRLDHPNVIKLEGLIASQNSSSLYLIFEYMEHDLTGLGSLPGNKFTEPQIKCYMQQLLSGLDYCHGQGILHRDIKGSNLLIDNNGILKIADFGLASFFDPRSSTQLTSRVVTLWYRAPELLLGVSHYGVAVDLWSTGCILAELYAGKPILPGRTEVEQLHKIFKLCGSPSEDYWKKSKLPHSSVIKPQRPYRCCVAETFKDFPAPAVGLMETLLSMDPAQRGTAALALKTEFFTTKPFACDPSNLPKYPPSKEIDAKLRDEEARRHEMFRRRGSVTKESADAMAPNNNAKLTIKQKRHHSSSNGRTEIFNTHKEQTVSGFLINPSKQPLVLNDRRRDPSEHQHKKVSHSGPLVRAAGWTKSQRDLDNSRAQPIRTNLSTIPGLVAARTSLPGDHEEKPRTSEPEAIKQVSTYQRPLNGLASTAKHDQNCQTPKTTDYPHAEEGRSSFRESNLYGGGSRGNKIYVSGPLLGPLNNMEEMLKEHDRKIQEFARRRLDKTKLGKVNPQGKLPTENSVLVSRH